MPNLSTPVTTCNYKSARRIFYTSDLHSPVLISKEVRAALYVIINRNKELPQRFKTLKEGTSYKVWRII